MKNKIYILTILAAFLVLSPMGTAQAGSAFYYKSGYGHGYNHHHSFYNKHRAYYPRYRYSGYKGHRYLRQNDYRWYHRQAHYDRYLYHKKHRLKAHQKKEDYYIDTTEEIDALEKKPDKE